MKRKFLTETCLSKFVYLEKTLKTFVFEYNAKYLLTLQKKSAGRVVIEF